jgi:THO complex subunit 1
MNVDSSNVPGNKDLSIHKATITITEPSQGANTRTIDLNSKAGDIDQKDSDDSLDYDALYPIFWSLQTYFSNPTSLFETENLSSFKSGLEATLLKFRQVQKGTDTVASTNEDQSSLKRKRQGEGESSKVAFNPKYLTSRDLFELEISDLAFRRHVLVQALIVLDFLLSQTPKAKAKLEHLKNKSVLWSFTLSEEHSNWAENMRNEIAAYLQQGGDGKFYFRMVDTVLSRDKNWAYWKGEGCINFSRDPVAPSQYAEARTGLKRSTALKRPKNNPLGALDLGFLSDSQTTDALDRLKDPSRSSVPAMGAYRMEIEDVTFDMDTAQGEQKDRLFEARASKTWRTLRIAAKSRFSVFDKLDDDNRLDVLFADPEDEKVTQEEYNEDRVEAKDQQTRPQDVVEATKGLDSATDVHGETPHAPTEAEAQQPNHEKVQAPPQGEGNTVESTKGDVTSDTTATKDAREAGAQDVGDPMAIEEPAIT